MSLFDSVTIEQVTFNSDDSRYSTQNTVSSFDKLVNCDSEFPEKINVIPCEATSSLDARDLIDKKS